jgi:hypothetical protein
MSKKMSEAKELATLLKSKPDSPRGRNFGKAVEAQPSSGAAEEKYAQKYVQWTTPDDRVYVPSTRSVKQMRPGIYEIMTSPQIGLYFERVEMTTESLLRFPDSNTDRVVAEVTTFWEREETFRQYGLPFKRGILLWGPPGGGKTSTIKLAIEDILKREGIVFKFTQPGLFSSALRAFRQIQPATPIIVLMEDLDAIIENFDESQVINILDGVDLVDKVVFLGSTNYPELLGPRILNRPSRFDKRFKIGMPSDEARGIYLEDLVRRSGLSLNLKQWVKDTKDFSLAHVKELFISVNIIQDDYNDALDTLRTMSDRISSSTEGRQGGFGDDDNDNG